MRAFMNGKNLTAAFLDALCANEFTCFGHTGYGHQSRARGKRTNVGRDDMDTAASELDERQGGDGSSRGGARAGGRWRLPRPTRRAVWGPVSRASCRKLIQRTTATQMTMTSHSMSLMGDAHDDVMTMTCTPRLVK